MSDQSMSDPEKWNREMRAWRHAIHRRPELAFREEYTSEFVADRLLEFGITVHRGLAGTGVVGVIEGRPGGRAVALRADMDALPIQERNTFEHRSAVGGCMHACGHDGHTAMLLGAAQRLARSGPREGTVYLVFQPAEENEGGARVMLEDGLFERFPPDAVYGMHNWPGLQAGTFGIAAGPVMAGVDRFEVSLHGTGAHAAMPHTGADPLVAAAGIVNAVQTIVSRRTNPLHSAVVSVTQVHGGDAWNVIPDKAVLRGSIRFFDDAVRERVEADLRRIVGGVCAAHDIRHEVVYRRGYPATVNSEREAAVAQRSAAAVVGAERVLCEDVPTMASEDFSYYLHRRPGCYVFLGAGDARHTAGLHTPGYDFNDEVLATGAQYWLRVVEAELGGS
jgi:hippurate hydrolase